MGLLEVRPQSGSFAVAEIVGVVPARDVADGAACQAVRNALAVHGVVCLRLDEALDNDAFRRILSVNADYPQRHRSQESRRTRNRCPNRCMSASASTPASPSKRTAISSARR
jgi:hypothetical protein